MEENFQSTNKAEIIEKWKKDLKVIEQDLVDLFTFKSIFEKFRKIVVVFENKSLKDKAFVSSFNVFANLVLRSYIVFIVMGIRRHIKSEENSISLLGLLDGIKNTLITLQRFILYLYIIVSILSRGWHGK